MTVSFVEPEQANDETRGFYDRAANTFEMVLNILTRSVSPFFGIKKMSPTSGFLADPRW